MKHLGYLHASAHAAHPAWNAHLALVCLVNIDLSLKTQKNYNASKEIKSRKCYYNKKGREYYVYM